MVSHTLALWYRLVGKSLTLVLNKLPMSLSVTCITLKREVRVHYRFSLLFVCPDTVLYVDGWPDGSMLQLFGLFFTLRDALCH